ncbi:hypothetical protein KR044_009039, partial [Drosophila immigrans]
KKLQIVISIFLVDYLLKATAASLGCVLMKYLLNKIKSLGNSKEKLIHEVLFFNELCHSCVHQHVAGGEECGNVYCMDRQVKRMQQMLDRSQYSIDLAIFSLSCPEMTDALERALRRGIKLRLIISETDGEESAVLRTLRRCGATIRKPAQSKNLMHHKFCVIDGHERVQQLLRRRLSCDDQVKALIKANSPLVMNGSANWTVGDLYTSYNSVIISSNHKLSTELETEFCRLWQKLKKPKERSSYTIS